MRFLLFCVFFIFTAQADIVEKILAQPEFLYTEQINLSPDVKKIAYTLSQKPKKRTIYVQNVDNQHVETIGFENANCWNPVWSPDAKSIAFLSDSTGTTQVWVEDVETGTSKNVIDEPVSSDQKMHWSEDGKTLYVQILEQDSPSNVRIYPIERSNQIHLAAIDVETSLVKKWTLNKAQFFEFSPCGNWILSLTDDTAYISSAQKPSQPLFLQPDVVDYRWHPTKDLLLYVKDKDLFCFDANRGQTRALAKDVDSLVICRENDVVIQTNGNLFAVYFEENERLEITFQDGWDLVEIISDEITLQRQTETGDIALIKNNQILWKGPGVLSECTQTDFGIFGFYENTHTPKNIVLIDDMMRQITDIKPAVALETKVEHIQTTVTLADGTKTEVITSILIPPAAKPEDKLAAIVLFYPGENVSEYASYFQGGSELTISNLLLLEQGYVLILADVPLGEEGVAANPVQEMCDVLLPQVDHAIDFGYIDPNRLALGGHSYGGYGTAAVLSHTNIFRAAIAVSGAYDLPGSYGYVDDTNFAINWSEKGQGRMGTHPWDDLQRYLNNSPYYHADKIQTPLLLVHGSKDTICPVVEAEKMFSALNRLDQDVELAVYEGQEHSIKDWDSLAEQDASRRILHFLQKHLGAPK